MPDYVISVRDVREDEFVSEPGRTRFLRVPGRQNPRPSHEINREEWVEQVLAAVECRSDPSIGVPVGDVLVFVHGYDTGPIDVIRRHRELEQTLQAVSYQGAIVSFDWPSAESAINYLEDRTDAKLTALKLVDDGIALLAHMQREDCRFNVHLLGYSMGAYVIREAFDDADDRPAIAAVNWSVSQIVFVAGDVSSFSLLAGNPESASLYRHAQGLTNYYNPFDAVLKLSNVKRVGAAPRAGRVGLPDPVPEKAVDVDCGPFFATLDVPEGTLPGLYAHRWYLSNPIFAQDLLYTLRGDIERNYIPTRIALPDNHLVLRDPTDDERVRLALAPSVRVED